MYLGSFGSEVDAARAYDRAAISREALGGRVTKLNFDRSEYGDELELLASLGLEVLLLGLLKDK